VTTPLVVSEAAVLEKSKHLAKSRLKSRIKRENVEIMIFLRQSLSNRSFSLLKRTDARGSADIMYHVTHIATL